MAKGVIQISEIANGILDPVLARRAGITSALIGCWEDMAGEDFATCTRPEKIIWARREPGQSEAALKPAVLTVACEGARALFLAHAQGELMQRINGFFGFPAIGQIKIVQKPMTPLPQKRKRLRALAGAEEAALAGRISAIENEPLKRALERLGRAVIGSKTG